MRIDDRTGQPLGLAAEGDLDEVGRAGTGGGGGESAGAAPFRELEGAVSAPVPKGGQIAARGVEFARDPGAMIAEARSRRRERFVVAPVGVVDRRDVKEKPERRGRGRRRGQVVDAARARRARLTARLGSGWVVAAGPFAPDGVCREPLTASSPCRSHLWRAVR